MDCRSHWTTACHSINKGQCVNVKLALKYDAVLRLNKTRQQQKTDPANEAELPTRRRF
jgi:hypothetical protein